LASLPESSNICNTTGSPYSTAATRELHLPASCLCVCRYSKKSFRCCFLPCSSVTYTNTKGELC
jgi:hypothetical protein